MGLFERYLTLWVFLCIIVGVALGQFLPAPFQWLGSMQVAQVNLPVGLLIWVMIIPMLLRIDFSSLRQVGRHWRGIGVTLFINWAVKPFSMAVLGWLFIRLYSRPICLQSSLIATLPGWCCWRQLPVPRWYLCGAGWSMASLCSPLARSR